MKTFLTSAQISCQQNLLILIETWASYNILNLKVSVMAKENSTSTITKETNFWGHLWEWVFLGRVVWGGKRVPKCGWRYSMGWDPGVKREGPLSTGRRHTPCFLPPDCRVYVSSCLMLPPLDLLHHGELYLKMNYTIGRQNASHYLNCFCLDCVTTKL